MTTRPKLPGIDYPLFVYDDDADDSIDLIYNALDEMMRADQFVQLDSFLAQVNVTLISPILMLAYLSITMIARNVLPSRACLVERTRERLSKLDPTRVDVLMQGLD